MDKAILAAHEVHKRAEINDVHDLAIIDLSDFGFLDDAKNPCLGRLDLRDVGRADLDQALVIDIDLGTCFRHDLADNLTAGPDHFADLRLIDLDRFDTRCVGRKPWSSHSGCAHGLRWPAIAPSP